MSTALKCPNPTCPYLFDPSRVPAGVVLTCPRCGMRFTLGPPAPSPSTARAQEAPPKPDGELEALSQRPEQPAPDGRPARRSFSAAGEPSRFQPYIIGFICIVLLAGVGTAIYLRFSEKPSVLGGGVDNQLREHNLSFEAPSAPWAMDDDMRAKLGPPMILAFKRTDPEAYIAIGAKNYQTREPRLFDLRTTIDQIIDRSFDEVKRYPIADATFLGHPASVAYKFEGLSKDGPRVVGLCFATSYKGIGYWSIAWAGEKDAEEQAATFETIRERLKIERNRESWSPKEQPVVTHGGHALSYQLLDGENIWTEPDAKKRSAASEDPKGDLLLVAEVKQKGQDRGEEATLVTLILDSDGGDALAQARRYIEDQRTQDVKAAGDKLMPKFAERTGAPEGDPPSNPVDTPAPMVRLQMTVQLASTFSQLLVISAIKIGDKVVVAYGHCGWGEREMFEGKMAQLAGSLRPSP